MSARYESARSALLAELAKVRTWVTADYLAKETGYSADYIRRCLNEMPRDRVRRTIGTAHLGPARYRLTDDRDDRD